MNRELQILYSGSLMESIPKNAGSFVGTILTRYGELVTRFESHQKWETINTPPVYLFLDIDINMTFLVDTNLKKIKIYEQ